MVSMVSMASMVSINPNNNNNNDDDNNKMYLFIHFKSNTNRQLQKNKNFYIKFDHAQGDTYFNLTEKGSLDRLKFTTVQFCFVSALGEGKQTNKI